MKTIVGSLLWVALMASAQGTGANDPWIQAIKDRDCPAIERLMAHSGDVNRPDRQAKTALMMAAGAAGAGCAHTVQALLEAGAEIDARNARGGTALMYAVMGGDPHIVQTLLDRGAKINAAGTNGWTAVMIASAKGRDAIIEILLRHGADINARDMYGWTPLMRAAYQGRVETVRTLLAHPGVDINARDDHGATVLHHVASMGSVEMTRLLMAHGADPASLDETGQTPLRVAMEYHHEGLRPLLEPTTAGP